MGLGVGLILAAAGAVLAFAVDTEVSGVNIHTIGWILLIAGSLEFCCRSSSGPRGPAPAASAAGGRRTTTRAPRAPAPLLDGTGRRAPLFARVVSCETCGLAS